MADGQMDQQKALPRTVAEMSAVDLVNEQIDALRTCVQASPGDLQVALAVSGQVHSLVRVRETKEIGHGG